MSDNLHAIGEVIAYIEKNLFEKRLDLDSVSEEIGYSKYHLHRMFSCVAGLTLHNYVQRRRLTEAARMLVCTDQTIFEIASCAGYDTQQSFSRAFKGLYKLSPRSFRKKGEFMPLQLKFDLSAREKRRGDRIEDINVIQKGSIALAGYSGSTRRGFHVIGTCWRRLHKNKSKIGHRTDEKFLTGVNDYSQFEQDNEKPEFRYMAAAQVTSFEHVPEDMETLLLPESRYVVFTFRGKSEESLQPVAEYIYREWFPNSTRLFNEQNLYDFAEYGEDTDENGESEIRYWVPVK